MACFNRFLIRSEESYKFDSHLFVRLDIDGCGVNGSGYLYRSRRTSRSRSCGRV